MAASLSASALRFCSSTCHVVVVVVFLCCCCCCHLVLLLLLSSCVVVVEQGLYLMHHTQSKSACHTRENKHRYVKHLLHATAKVLPPPFSIPTRTSRSCRLSTTSCCLCCSSVRRRRSSRSYLRSSVRWSTSSLTVTRLRRRLARAANLSVDSVSVAQHIYFSASCQKERKRAAWNTLY